MKTTIKCQYCGFRFPSIWTTQGGAVKDERGFFCSVRCQMNANAENYGGKCAFCGQKVQNPLVLGGLMFCGGRHANLYAMLKQRKG